MSLNEDEMRLAVAVGRARHRTARSRGHDLWAKKYGQPVNSDAEDAVRKDINAVAAELLVAKITNRYWHPDFHPQDESEPDVGDDIQVRWTHHASGHLIFHPQDYDDQFYFLVTGWLPDLTVRGYLPGNECRRGEWFTTPYENRPEAFYVPQHALYTFGEARVG